MGHGFDLSNNASCQAGDSFDLTLNLSNVSSQFYNGQFTGTTWGTGSYTVHYTMAAVRGVGVVAAPK